MLVLFYGEGRLGNQIFQYQALNGLAGRSGRIIAIGLEDLHSAISCTGATVTVVSRSYWLKRIFKYIVIPLLLRPLARYIRLFGYAHEKTSGQSHRSGPSGILSRQRGLIGSIVFADGGYYQCTDTWQSIFPCADLKISRSLAAQAHALLNSIIDEDSLRVFVHVRRGDLLNYRTYGQQNIALPESYYRNAIGEFTRRVSRPHFVFVTDDADWVAERFRDVHSKSVLSLSTELDFVIMTACQGGILSNSTFSLAAALLSANPALMLAPLYWFGFRVSEWLPPRIRIHHPSLVYLPVPLEEENA
jgi:hypothetical protein